MAKKKLKREVKENKKRKNAIPVMSEEKIKQIDEFMADPSKLTINGEPLVNHLEFYKTCLSAWKDYYDGFKPYLEQFDSANDEKERMKIENDREKVTARSLEYDRKLIEHILRNPDSWDDFILALEDENLSDGRFDDFFSEFNETFLDYCGVNIRETPVSEMPFITKKMKNSQFLIERLLKTIDGKPSLTSRELHFNELFAKVKFEIPSCLTSPREQFMKQIYALRSLAIGLHSVPVSRLENNLKILTSRISELENFSTLIRN